MSWGLGRSPGRRRHRPGGYGRRKVAVCRVVVSAPDLVVLVVRICAVLGRLVCRVPGFQFRVDGLPPDGRRERSGKAPARGCGRLRPL
jgi:hypothetical protein